MRPSPGDLYLLESDVILYASRKVVKTEATGTVVHVVLGEDWVGNGDKSLAIIIFVDDGCNTCDTLVLTRRGIMWTWGRELKTRVAP